MGTISQPTPVKLFTGVISGFEEDVKKAETDLENHFGLIDYRAGPITFDFTDYYTPQMGSNLKRYFISFKKLIDPGQLPDIKILTNEIEETNAQKNSTVERSINLDPGYVSAANMVLASTKNYVHRIYIGKGIYAELEYIFGKNSLHFFKWTYPDYRTEDYTKFFIEIKKRYLAQLRELSIRGE